MKKTSTYLFTRISVVLFIVIGLILASFPGIYAKTNAILIDGQDVLFETFIPTYTSIFGGKLETNLILNNDFLSLKDNPEVISILDKNLTISVKTNILCTIFFVLSLISVIIFFLYAKSRIVSVITTTILIATTITFATSNLTFMMSNNLGISFNPNYELSLGFMFLTLTYAIASTILMFHLFRILIKPNSLKLEIDQSSLN